MSKTKRPERQKDKKTKRQKDQTEKQQDRKTESQLMFRQKNLFLTNHHHFWLL
jgi:hypothetical protein